jgi:hypothetical protein
MGLAALLLLLGACSRDEPQQPSETRAAPKGGAEADGRKSDEGCDMPGDMSKMTPEEHQRMMERCQQDPRQERR